MGPSPVAARSTTAKVKRHPVDSTAVRSLGYRPDREILEIEYQNGRVYRYFGVPQAVFDALMGGGSIGEFVNLNIKPAYPSKEMIGGFAWPR